MSLHTGEATSRGHLGSNYTLWKPSGGGFAVSSVNTLFANFTACRIDVSRKVRGPFDGYSNLVLPALYDLLTIPFQILLLAVYLVAAAIFGVCK